MKLKQSKVYRNAVRTVIGLILMIAGVAWFLFPTCREWTQRKEADDVLTRFVKSGDTGDQPQDDTVSETPEQSTEQPTDYQELYSDMRRYNDELAHNGQKLTDAWSFEQTPVDLSSLGSDSSAIGCIEIPDMDVKMPLYIGASKSSLSKGAAVLAGTSMPVGGRSTNCVICGHRGWRGSAFFRNIEDMQNGSMVYLTNPWGTLTYKAVSAKIIHKTEADAILIQPGKDMVTLFSCYPYGHTGTPYRYVVFCERTEEALYEAGSVNAPTVKEPLRVDGVKVDQRVADAENTLLFWEQVLRRILPAAVVIIALLICLAHRISPKGKNRRKNRK